jgi:hypothetical protein
MCIVLFFDEKRSIVGRSVRVLLCGSDKDDDRQEEEKEKEKENEVKEEVNEDELRMSRAKRE